MKVTIKSVTIEKFRNIKNTLVVIGCSTVIYGKNRLGKTNVLNAIHWCLTGYDLYGNSKDMMNVPFDVAENLNEGDTCVDVTVELDVGKINRRVIFKNGSYSQAIAINDLDCKTLREGESQIDSILGISDLALTGSKDFNVRRFLLNPLYFTQCKESAFREFIIKQLVGIDPLTVYDSLPDTVKSLIPRKDIAVLSQDNDKEIKSVKKNIEFWKTIKEYCTNYNKELVVDLKAANNSLDTLKKSLADLTDKSVAIDNYALELSKTYQVACNNAFKGIDIVLLEKGQGEDVWKNTCTIISSITNTKIDYCSTSESILTGCNFICKFATKIKSAPHLPLLLDEFETLDNSSCSALIKKMNTQLVAACVGDDDSFRFEKLAD